jgi:hypothetical protein
MIRLNPVTDVVDSVSRGLVAVITPLEQLLGSNEFKEILTTDATTEDRENKVAEYFKIENAWERLLEKWQQDNQNITGFKQYYEFLFFVESKSKHDRVWFSFFKGMHRHAAIVAGLVCFQFNLSFKELDVGSLKLDDFRNEGVIKSFRDPGITVKEHVDMIMTKQIEVPMFTNAFHLSAYIPKTENPGENAGKIIKGARLQSQWISRFKVGSARITISKNIATWLKTIQQHSTGQTRSNPKYRPKISGKDTPIIGPHTDTKLHAFKKMTEESGGEDDSFVYGCPSVIKNETWNAYISSPFNPIAR